MEDTIRCPMIDEMIDASECVENVDIVDGLVIETSMPEKFKVKKDWKNICMNCKYHDM